MGDVMKSAYRQPPTPSGLKKIEDGTMEWFDIQMYSNFNTGVLEQYFDEKNKRDGFTSLQWTWWKILVGVGIGVVFAMINQYVGLKIGMVIGGSWYISYLVGMGMRWSPTEINLSSGASTGASMICTGFVFTFPAMYILAYKDGTVITPGDIPPLGAVIVATTFAGFLGVLYFIIFRRVWLIEDPLPMPTFEAWVQLLDIAHDVSGGAAERAKSTIKKVAGFGALSAGFTFMRDFPIMENTKPELFGQDTEKISIFDRGFGGDYYEMGDLHQPYDTANYTWVDFQFTPMLIATGWFMRWRSALLVSLGTLFTWLCVVPMAVHLEVPIYVEDFDVYTKISSFDGSAIVAAGAIARIMAIGAILGGGMTGLLKMAPTFKTTTEDLLKIKKGGMTSEYIPGKGWYEWPMAHILVMIVITFIAIVIAFPMSGFPFAQSAVFAFILVATTFFLGAIAVKVMGETSIEPVSGTSFIVLLMLVLTLQAMGTSDKTTVIMAIIGTTVFGGAISMSGDIILDFKNALYIGNRPYLQMKAEMIGIPFGAMVAGFAAAMFSEQLAKGEIDLLAPQAHAFAAFVKILVGGNVNYNIFLFGIAIGIFVELITGMGTAFGLGMYFPLGLAFPLMLGGGLRDLWQKHVYEPKAKAEGWSEKTKTMRLLDTYMIATGLIVGEAIMGTIVAVYFVFS